MKLNLNTVFGIFCFLTGISLFINPYLAVINFGASLIFHPKGIIQEFAKASKTEGGKE